jgi:hypothetical protein
LRDVRKNIEQEEKAQIEERINRGTATSSTTRLYSEDEIRHKTLNQFLIKYKEKFSYEGRRDSSKKA